jgi:hypothetical protein
MKHRNLSLCIGLLALALSPVFAVESNDEVAAHSSAFELAGAFQNDGFKLRDGHWNGKVQPGKSQVIQVNLYAGNQYWFTIGTASGGKPANVSLSIYDETGKALPCESQAEGGRAAAGFSPEASGPYFVKVQEKEGAPATFCLLYSYK